MVCFRGSLAPSRTVRRIRAICTNVSLYIESFLCYLHTILYFFLFHTYEKAPRAWWDSDKASAVVIYAPHNDAVARYVALRLSSGSPSSFALKDVGPTARNPRAPYTCFVLHGDPEQFSITVAQWAAKKARIEKALLKQTNGGKPASSHSSPPSSPTSSAPAYDAESTRDESVAAPSHPDSPAATGSTFQARRSDGGRDETPRANRTRPRPPPIRIGAGLRRRSRSWSSWAAPELIGYGVDMLKGWMPGRSGPKTTPSGTIIPIMADVQTADGLAMVNSTISAYCSSHDLLLSGVILIPSVLCPRNVPLTRSTASASSSRIEMPKTPGSAYSDVDPFTLSNRDVWGELRASPSGRSAPGSTGGAAHPGPRDPFGLAPAFRETDLGASVESSSSSSQFNSHASPPLSPASSRIVRAQDDEQVALQSALSTDVVQSRALINVLFPALKRDKGRIVGLVPCGYGVDLPQDPDTLSLQSMPPRTSSSGKSRDRSLSSASSATGDPPILRIWPSSVVNTIRDTLRTQYRELEFEYRRRGGGAHLVDVSMIETSALVQLPQTRLKKVVKWNESVRYFTPSRPRWGGLATRYRIWDNLPFLGRFGRLSRDDTYDRIFQRRGLPPTRYDMLVPAELRPYLTGWSKPFAEAPSTTEDGEPYTPLPVRALRRLVRVFKWLEMCLIPFDDLAEHIAAVSYPIALGSSCPPTPGPSQSLLHPYTVSSNHTKTQRSYPKPMYSKTYDFEADETPDFPFSTASSGPAIAQIPAKDPIRFPRVYPKELAHQDPTPLFEAIRCALISYHPRSVYYPALSAWIESWIHGLAPWVHDELKSALARYLSLYAREDGAIVQG